MPVSGTAAPPADYQAVLSTIMFSATSAVNATITIAVGDNGTSTTVATTSVTVVQGAPTAPVVASISPSSGPASGGTGVTITGSDFTAASTVEFGTNAATAVTYVSATEIQATAPAGVGMVDITVTTSGQTSATSTADQFSYVPSVTSINPSSGPAAGSTVVTIDGTGFTTASTVDFGTTAAAAMTYISSGEIQAISPAGAGTVDVTVTTSGQTSATSTADQFSYTTAPTVTSVSPLAGPLAGGGTVTITGTDFTGATAVDFGTIAVSNVTVNATGTQITATSPQESAATVHLTVVGPDGTSATSSADQFTFEAAPAVTGVSPLAGPLAGGKTVTITGTGFIGATAVDFGTVAASNVTVNAAGTQITATSPPESAATVNVTVVAPGGVQTTSTADQFTYEPAPTVTSVSPTAGPLAGGTTVTISGTDFTGVTAVDFGTVAATNVVINATGTLITATSPQESAATVNVTVVGPGGTSATLTADQFTYTPGPAVTSVSPLAGPLAGGETVTITGTGFTNATAVDFGTVAVSNLLVAPSGTQITVTSPQESAATVNVTVVGPNGTSATSSADQFTFEAAPAVTSVSPLAGPLAGGKTVTITGTGFIGATAVDFGTAAASNVTVNSAGTQITATSPPESAATVNVTVIAPGGVQTTSTADQFTYMAAPTVTIVSPTAGPLAGGTTVTISGTGFTGATAVDFGTVAASNVVINPAGTQITATSPQESAATVNVTVVGPGGTSATTTADQFTYTPAPTVTGVSPVAGPLAGGETVTITGTGFTGATAVDFGTVAASNVTVNLTGTQITATSPQESAATVDLTVIGPGGTSTTSAADHFTFEAAPAVTSVSPTAGPLAGGKTVTIAGTGFIGATAVDFGTVAATNVVVNSAERRSRPPARRNRPPPWT